MRSRFGSQYLWEIVTYGFMEPMAKQEAAYTIDAKQTLKEQRKKDKKAFFILHQGLDDATFEKVFEVPTSKQALEILASIFKGDNR